MAIKIMEVATINDKLKKLIQSGNYEQLLLNLMNSSKKVFPNTYQYIEEQSNGESDFIDLTSFQKYDAKLPFSSHQGKLIGQRDSDYSKWIETMINEKCEFGKFIEERGKHNIADLTLYKIIRDRLLSVSMDEHPIFFFPYPIVLDGEEFTILQQSGDMLSAIFSEIKGNGLLKGRYLYVVYPCYDEKIVIRCLNTNAREYLSNAELNEFVHYNISFE